MSRLGLGCGAVLGRVGRKQALYALDLAYDSGVTHFDVARSYGFGEAEGLLGQFLQDKRHEVTLTTKFGVMPPRNAALLGLAKSAARAVMARIPATRGLGRAAASQMLSHRDYSPAYARSCLDTSLRQLRVEQIDYYLIHDPDTADIGEELMRFLEQARGAGKIARWGISADRPAVLASPAAARADVLLYEANVNVLDTLPLAPAGDHRQRFLTRPFGGGGAAIEGLRHRPQVRSALRKLGLEDLDDHTVALYFSLSLAGQHGVVVTSMFDPAHLRQNLRAAEHFRALGERGWQLAPEILGIAPASERGPCGSGHGRCASGTPVMPDA